MTAIVGFMNKHGVVMAADSAVTLGNTHKVINSGNKIFTLSKYAPVGIATYGNASFMETPWELIIKLYRKNLKKQKLNSLQDYVDSFIHYLHSNNFFITEDLQKQLLLHRAISFYSICVEDSKKYDGYSERHAVSFLKKSLETCQELNKKNTANIFTEMGNYDYSKFIVYFSDIFQENLDSFPLLSLAESQQVFLTSFYQYLRILISYNSDTGLVFFGYGEDEIYPSIINVIVADSFDGCLRYKSIVGNSGQISVNGHTAYVIPFAQIDVSQTIIRGINPAFYDVMAHAFEGVLDAYRNVLLSLIPESNSDVIANIKSINHTDFSQSFISSASDEFKQNYTDALLQTIASLSKEDMAVMAESFVSLTSLVRRMTPMEETVGGPIDVAVVSKGDGFIWLKRKHYFDPELNMNFTNNYYDE